MDKKTKTMFSAELDFCLDCGFDEPVDIEEYYDDAAQLIRILSVRKNEAAKACIEMLRGGAISIPNTMKDEVMAVLNKTNTCRPNVIRLHRVMEPARGNEFVFVLGIVFEDIEHNIVLTHDCSEVVAYNHSDEPVQ